LQNELTFQEQAELIALTIKATLIDKKLNVGYFITIISDQNLSFATNIEGIDDKISLLVATLGVISSEDTVSFTELKDGTSH
jgi:hypothetical protein